MKVAFSNPLEKEHDRSMGISTAFVFLGSMLYEQTRLNRSKIADVMIDDPNIIDLKQWKNNLVEFGADIVGTTPYDSNYRGARLLNDSSKEVRPDSLFIIGGPAVTRTPGFFLLYTGADAAFRGDAVFTFREGIEMIKRGEPVDNLLGLDGVLLQKDEKILAGPNSEKIPRLEQSELRKIDFNLDLLVDAQNRLNYPEMGFAFSLSCPNETCSFCQISPEEIYRTLRIEQILPIISEVSSKIPMKNFIFYDPLFGGSPKGAETLLNKLLDSDFAIKEYGVQTSIDMMLQEGEFGKRKVNENIINLMKELNVYLQISPEHLSTGGLKKYNKHRYTPEEAMEVIRALHHNGVCSLVYLIHMGPDTSGTDLAEHLSNIIKLYDEIIPSTYVRFNYIDKTVPHAGTGEYKKLVKKINADPKYKELMEVWTFLREHPYKDTYKGEKYDYTITDYFPFDDVVKGACAVLWSLQIMRAGDYSLPAPEPVREDFEKKLAGDFEMFLMAEAIRKTEPGRILDSYKPTNNTILYMQDIARKALNDLKENAEIFLGR